MPLRLEAAILSRTRSPISSRSNWANDSSTLSVSRPMLELVLKDCVTDTNETPWASNSSMSVAIERGAGECAIVVTAGDQAPAFVRLTPDIGLAGLALGVERAEGKVEVMLARLAGIDRTARELAEGAVHATESP